MDSIIDKVIRVTGYIIRFTIRSLLAIVIILDGVDVGMIEVKLIHPGIRGFS